MYGYRSSQINQQAEEELYQAKEQLILVEKKYGGQLLGSNGNPGFFNQKKKASYNSEIDNSSKQYISVIEKWIKYPAGLVAAGEMAGFLYQYEGKEQEALELLKRALQSAKKSVSADLVSFQLSVYLMNSGEYEEAVSYLERITQSQESKWLWSEAFLKIGLSYEKQDKRDQAEKFYRMVQRDFPDSSSSDRALQYLNGLKIQTSLSQQNLQKEQ